MIGPRLISGGMAAFLVVATAALSACVNVSSLDGSEIAEQAKGISANQAIQIRTISNVQETARTETDARCTATAELSDGRTTTVYLRAYEEGDNTMVAYQETAFP
jgi:hypothetical protein